MNYNGITWGPSMRGYLSDNKARIGRCEASLVSLKNQDGQFAREHRMLLDVYRDIEALLLKHIELADAANPPGGEPRHDLPFHQETIDGLSALTIRRETRLPRELIDREPDHGQYLPPRT